MLLNEGMITLILKVKKLGLPWWSSGEDSTSQMQGGVGSIPGGKMDPTCGSQQK